ncbi:hypothetical protein DRF60_06520 [Chryseobacterium elymi]|uniref:Uncharacterized protein n=1 Tax=Chryseobacterium elymi TaxID=395936 RepID=A0A3D9DNC5_9FLAO|nr:hypothetical protein [Chryseobacterium elymi]REC79473.1 hypothetical protein DRF60_06520 [Chryseobacterium elymi]
MTISEIDYLLTVDYLKKTLDKGDKYLAYGWIAVCTLEDLKSLPTSGLIVMRQNIALKTPRIVIL